MFFITDRCYCWTRGHFQCERPMGVYQCISVRRFWEISRILDLTEHWWKYCPTVQCWLFFSVIFPYVSYAMWNLGHQLQSWSTWRCPILAGYAKNNEYPVYKNIYMHIYMNFLALLVGEPFFGSCYCWCNHFSVEIPFIVFYTFISDGMAKTVIYEQ